MSFYSLLLPFLLSPLVMSEIVLVQNQVNWGSNHNVSPHHKHLWGFIVITMYLFLPSNPNASDKIIRHQAMFLNKMFHCWSCNLRVARKFIGLPPVEAIFTCCPWNKNLTLPFSFQTEIFIMTKQDVGQETSTDIPRRIVAIKSNLTCISNLFLRYNF